MKMKRLIKKISYVPLHPHNKMTKKDRKEYFSGFEENNYQKMEQLLMNLGLGGEAQQKAKEEIIDAIRNKTSLGEILLEQISLETSLYEQWLSEYKSYIENEVQKAKESFDPKNNYYEYDFDNADEYGDYVRKELSENLYLYRKGDHGDIIESWTTNSDGADMGYGTIGWDYRKTFDELKAEGYQILGGVSKMMGAPGESEITLIKLNDII